MRTKTLFIWIREICFWFQYSRPKLERSDSTRMHRKNQLFYAISWILTMLLEGFGAALRRYLWKTESKLYSRALLYLAESTA